ncbi:hypothetical protein [Azohydromonas aeria]|uniref:hypothetical protein n=1 Tax=Azohydromonas aeria TaxID=2590212 RepID=UPI0012F9F788|nr:hypothetical protein [Azohydromonas aeria]
MARPPRRRAQPGSAVAATLALMAGRVRRVKRERARAVVEWLALAAIVAAVYAFVPVVA